MVCCEVGQEVPAMFLFIAVFHPAQPACALSLSHNAAPRIIRPHRCALSALWLPLIVLVAVRANWTSEPRVISDCHASEGELGVCSA